MERSWCRADNYKALVWRRQVKFGASYGALCPNRNNSITSRPAVASRRVNQGDFKFRFGAWPVVIGQIRYLREVTRAIIGLVDNPTGCPVAI